jgi:long-chain-fatty-acid--coA ligase
MHPLVATYCHPLAKINGYSCYSKGLISLIALWTESNEVHLQKTAAFLSQWLDENDTLTLHTSGTTGVPKEISVKKEHMIHSAQLTGAFLQLQVGDRALCALPTDYIAGKMMLVRTLVLGLSLEVVAPSSTPFVSIDGEVDFVALTPMQAFKSLEQLHRARKIILGGAPISLSMETAFQEVPSQIYATYGMTETVSHIALRPIAPKEQHSLRYTTIGAITIRQDSQGCLVIDCPEVADMPIYTHDVVTLYNDRSFQWQGRLDNIINSAGVKIFPESVEERLATFITDRFFIWKEPDALLGEKVILLIEGREEAYRDLLMNLQKETVFSKYELPKKIYYLPHFKTTESGKIQREITAKLVL